MRGTDPVNPIDRHTNTAAGTLPRFIESFLQGRRLSGHTPGLFRRDPVFADTATHASAVSTNERTPALSLRNLLFNGGTGSSTRPVVWEIAAHFKPKFARVNTQRCISRYVPWNSVALCESLKSRVQKAKSRSGQPT